MLWARVCGCGGPTLSPWPACPVGAACRGGGRGPSPGGVACHRCEGRLVSGAVPAPAARPLGRAAGVSGPVSPGCGRCGRETQQRPHSVRPCGPALLTVGVAKGRSRGGVFHRCQGHLWSGAPPSQTAHPVGGLFGSVTHMLWSRACECGGPTLSPWPACPVGVVRGRPRGGRPATVVRLVWCQAPSLPRPPALWGGRPGFCDLCVPGAVAAGVGTRHRPHSVRPSGPALLAVGVAEGRPRGVCLPPL